MIPASASNVVARTDLVRRVGSFDEQFNHFADWDLWIRLAAAAPASAVPDVLVAYRHHRQGQVSELEHEVLAELDGMEEKHRALCERHGTAMDRDAVVRWASRRARKAAARSDARRRAVVAREAALLVKRALRRAGAAGRLPRPDWLRGAR